MHFVKPVNTDSRIPAFLQTHTKQNLIFQITLAVVFIAGMELKDRHEKRQFEKHYAENANVTPIK